MQALLSPKDKLLAENPFYGMEATLALLQQCGKMTDSPSKSAVVQLLNKSWGECKDDANKKKMFFSVVFSIGDIPNREHNIFRKKGIKNADQGGSGLRKAFLYCLEWIHNNLTKQFYSLLPILGEYYNLGAMTMFHILWTDRFKGTVKEVYRVNVDVDKLTTYIAAVLSDAKTTENEKALWAKWLWHIPKARTKKITVTEKNKDKLSKIPGIKDLEVGSHLVQARPKLDETKSKDKTTFQCIRLLSEKMKWEIKKHVKNDDFVGYAAFRTKYLSATEAALFSSKKILQMDKVQFFEWLETLPAGARYAVQRRLVSKTGNKYEAKTKWITPKGVNLGSLFIEWLDHKAKAQETVRSLSEDDKAKMAPKELKELQKAAKVNTGGITLLDVAADLFASKDAQNTNMLAQALLDKVKLNVPVMVVVDVSTSMAWANKSVTHKNVPFLPIQMACLLTTTFLLKNPNKELQSTLIRFSDKAEVLYQGKETEEKDRFMRSKATSVELVNPAHDFITNFNNIAKHLQPNGGTQFDKVADNLKAWVDQGGGVYADVRKEMINNYPVWVVVSDGDMNGAGNATEVMAQFQQKMRQWFGWEGVIVVWDVKQTADQVNKYKNLPNVMYIGTCNVGTMDQIFTRIDDVEIIDVYTVLNTMFKSNRYTPVRELVS